MAMRSWMAGQVSEATRRWWILLISGALWVVLSLAILQFNLTSVWSIAILTGTVLILAGATEFGIMTIAPSWKWAHALLGLLFVAGGVVAFAWPQSTFLVLARLISWYLLFVGVFEVVEALAFRRVEWWWMRLIGGLATIGIAIWAADSLSRSATLLVLWVGIGALFRGLNQIFLAFEFRSVHEEFKTLATPPSSDSAERSDRPLTGTPARSR